MKERKQPAFAGCFLQKISGSDAIAPLPLRD